MHVSKTPLEGVIVIEPEVHGDARGFLLESYQETARSFRMTITGSCTFHRATRTGLWCFQNVPMAYRCTDFYVPGDNAVILWDDPQLQIDWPVRTPAFGSRRGEHVAY